MKRKTDGSVEITLKVNEYFARWLERAVHNTMLGCTPEQVAVHLLISAAESRDPSNTRRP